MLAEDAESPKLSATGKLAAAGIGLTAAALLLSSALGLQLGLPTSICGVLTAMAVLIMGRSPPWKMLKGIAWGVLPLVAGLFVLVEALDKTGLIGTIGDMLRMATEQSETQTACGAAGLIAFACNLINNLPAALLAGSALQLAHAPDRVISATLVGVDLGPQPLGYRLTCDHPLAHRAQAGRSQRQRLVLPQTRHACDATGPFAGDRQPVSFLRSNSWRFQWKA
jgi:arsenical pump membrane protein